MSRHNKALSAYRHLARHPRRLFKLELRVYKGAAAAGSATGTAAGTAHPTSAGAVGGACLVSPRAVRAQHARYPAIKFTHKRRYRVTLYAHVIVVLATRIRTRQATTMWDPSKLNVSHSCHNTRCVNPAHLALVTPANNTSRTHHCVARVTCPSCPAAFNLCHHSPPCLTTISTPCSSCA